MATYDILLQNTNATPLLSGTASSSITFLYPSGKSYLDYTPGNEQLSIPSRQLVLNVNVGFTVSYTIAGIVVFWSGGFTIPANTTIKLQTGAYVPFSPTWSLPNVYNFDGAFLSKWRAALAKVRQGVQNARVGCVGMSTTRGVGSTAGGTMWKLSYPGQMADILNKMLGMYFDDKHPNASGYSDIALATSNVLLRAA